MRVRRLLRPALAAAALLGAACGSDATPTSDRFVGNLHVVNGSASTIDVLIDGSARIASLAPGAISPTLMLPMTTSRLELRPTGAASGTTITADPRPTGGVLFVAALGTPGSTVSAVALADTGAIPSQGKAKVQAIHLAARAPAIWVWRKQPDYPDPVTFMFPHAYGASTAYVEATPGTWEIYVTPAGVNPAVTTLAHASFNVAANQALRVAVLDSASTVKIAPLTP